MSLGIHRGVFSGVDNGIVDGGNTGILRGIENGLYENTNKGIIRKGLVLHLDAGNASSYLPPYNTTTWNDISGKNNNGTLVNGPTFNSQNGGSIVFDGSNDYVSTQYNETLNDFTACVWFKANSSTPAAGRILDKDYFFGFWIGKNSNNSANSWGGGVRDTDPPYGRFITLTDNQWHYIVSIRRGTTHTIFGDGISNTISGIVSSTSFSNANLFIGTVSGFSSSSLFNGNISQVKIYNRALSRQEVLQNYMATRIRY